VNLSIHDINRRFFRDAQRWHPNRWWSVLAFEPEIVDHNGVYFATTNNAYGWAVQRKQGLDGLRALFEEPMRHGGMFVTHQPSTGPSPSCPQAEVLYPGQLGTSHLQRVYVRNPDNYREARSYLTFLPSNVEVVLSPERFEAVETNPCERMS